MLALPDAPSNQSLLNDAFDYSRYPTFRAKDILYPTSSPNLYCSIRQQAFFASFKESSPRKESRCHPRNVSEPQLISSTNYMRESWYANFGSARTVGDIANLSTHNDLVNRRNDVREAPPLLLRPSQDAYKHIQSRDHEDGEEGSLYSMDSADQEAHPFLLSMPIIPQIKLERKATVRKPEPGLPLDDTHRSLLSPRIKGLRTPARVASRRYGHIGLGTSSRVVADPPMAQIKPTLDALDRAGRDQDRGTDRPATMRGFSAYPNSPETSDDEEQPLLKKDVESPHADVLLSLIDDAESSLSSEGTESSLDETSPLMRVPPKHSQRSHRRSTATNHSLSFSSFVHAVADGCASLDTILRKPTKPRLKTKQTSKAQVPIHNAPNPTSKWALNNGQIVIKVFVPSTDDIWALLVPEDITLVDFTSRVICKLGFSVSFSGSLWDEPKYHFTTDERFRAWVKRRVRFGRNLPIVAHVVPPLPLIKLSAEADGCEIWCYA